ncbi:2,3-diketo-5-methylthiopentyl-1-phosphate enolase [Thermoactinomyces sp. DSM 45892]|uniref:2,3-diketo-5-methylthiopentyl-1-phosphate enolase n=1 Tax=Thermoactinomyces sp. DSM 45892 TaxID=1882753 RepID=UPI000897FA3A|nr:2,3-diketo-5-methylthiopentyl-1-phosphate enolase [Thermoactinomyces sp. DSM 45892]SDZ04192.1 2,3-diketo-5-methylthiopentyl-1-phosphate enolase [Thermoactinomyces sp. DSM 45892]
MTRLIATYLVHDKKQDLVKKAESIALGLTIGSWTELPLLIQEQLKLHKGEVVEVIELDEDLGANQYLGGTCTRGLLKIAYPAVNFSNDLPAILTTVFGKLSLDGEVKLVDLHFSDELLSSYPGPKYGIQGVREKVGVIDRPLLMSIFKSVMGRDLDYFREQLRLQALGGVDLVKDDEILFDNPLTPWEDRVRTAVNVLSEAESLTGEKTLYAVNITGRSSQLRDRARKAIELGANALLFNVFTYGLDVLQELSEDPEVAVPILAHPAFSGAFTSSAFYGVSHSLALGTLLRVAGADLSLFPSPYGSVVLAKEETLRIAHSLRTDQLALRPAFPVPSAGIHPGIVPRLIHDFGMDSVINAGGGVHGHPSGTVAGGKAFRQAIEIALAGKAWTEVASDKKNYFELNQAISLWGGK